MRWMTKALVAWVDLMRRSAVAVVAVAVLLALASVRYTASNLGIDTDTADMISGELAWREQHEAYKAAFPDEVDNLVIVIDGETPEIAERASRALADALAAETALVEKVRRPHSGPFFERHGLLYLEVAELEALASRLTEIQPFLGTLLRDRSLVGVVSLLREAIAARSRGMDLELAPFLDAVARAAEASTRGEFHELSWQRLIAGDAPGGRDTRRFVLVKPDLDWSRLFPAEDVLALIDELARELELVPARGVHVRVTGAIAMEHEELDTVVRGAELVGVLALVTVSIVLVLGLRSVRLVAASIVTLLLGLAWTAAFATAAVGHLNLISVAFAVLYIGLGVAYAIHYCLRYRELVSHGRDHAAALREGAGDVGGSLLICALTTGAGFYAFVPTDFLGVSELGLISGTGMFISLFASLTVLPALLTLMPLAHVAPFAATPGRIRHRLAQLPYRRRRQVISAAVVLGLLASAALPWARFDRNPLNLRSPEGEALSTFRELLAEADPSPWPLVVLARDAEHAARVAESLEDLEAVDLVLSLDDFVPENQAAKLAILEELDLILSLDFDAPPPASAPSHEEQRRALEALRADLDALAADPGQGDAARRLQDALESLAETGSGGGGAAPEALDRFSRSVLGGLSDQLATLEASLEAGPVTRESLPESVTRKWLAPDGRWRVEAYPAADLNDPEALASFLETARRVAPEGIGDIVVYIESGNAVANAFKEAMALAFGLITLILWVLLHRLRGVVEVLFPLVLGLVLTVGVMTLMGMPFNFANVIALPLLLGVGVDNGIHMVHRMRSAPPAEGNLLETSTARAIVCSALTTIASFGNLAFSPHPGTASMGLVLTLGLGITLLTTLVVLPALLVGDPRLAREASV